MDATAKLVTNCLAQEQSLATEIAGNLAQAGQPVGDTTICQFFPELSNLCGGRRSNLVRDVPLPHQILLGPPLIFDLEPVTERQFEDRYRIPVRAAEEFAEAGRLIPSLYVRNPDRWVGMGHLEGLLQRSIASGVRVDAYFRLRDPQFEDRISIRGEQFERKLRQVEQRDPARRISLVEEARSDRAEVPRVIGTRWAYLDVLAPPNSAYVERLVEESRLDEALEFVWLTKHAVVSPISAALGGEFTWAKRNIARLQQAGVARPKIPRTPSYFERPEDVEFLIHHVTGVSPFRCLKDYHSDMLSELFTSTDLDSLKAKLYETMEVMAKLAQQGVVNEARVDDWKRLTAEIRRILETYQRYGSKAADIGIGLTVGYLIDPLFGLGAGVLAEPILGEHVDKVGGTLYRLVNPEKHRFLQLLDDLRPPK